MKEPNRRHTIHTRSLDLLVDTLQEFDSQWRETGRFSVVRATSTIQRLYLDRWQYIAYADVMFALRRLALHGIVRLDGARWVLGGAGERAA